MTSKAPITAVVITKNEEKAIARCLQALSFCNQVLVIDSNSSDRTTEIANALGAEVVTFTWDGTYPKKKQWGMDHPSVRHDWVLHIDGDEVVTPALAEEISYRVVRETCYVAYEIPIEYHFMGRALRHGHRVVKRSLVRRSRAKFPEVGDLAAPGITEVEGHYQPEVNGRIGRFAAELVHDDLDPISDWIARHNRYSDWEVFLLDNDVVRQGVRGNRSQGGQFFDKIPMKPFAFFMYSYFYKRGFLDGRAGFYYALNLSWYYWTIKMKYIYAKQSRRR